MLSGITALKNDGTNITGNISTKTSSNMTASGATVTAPAGYYASDASKSVASGTVGTPTATKGTVSNHSVNVTPSVTHTAGYISGGTKTGAAVTVSASELVSDTLIINSSGTKNVTNYASASIAAGSATTPATTITANPSISVSSGGLITATVSTTESITPTVSAGYVSSGTAGIATVSGSNTSQLTTQAAQTIHPSTSAQTISSGKYLTGTQTISAVTLSNLTAGNIKKDVVVKIGDSSDDDCVASVTGTYEGDSGVDFPTFTINFDDDSGILSITCNKTYAECLEYFDDNDDEMTNGAIINTKYYDNNTLVYEMTSGASAIPPASGATSIVYTMPTPYDGMIPWIVITYSSSGTITWSENPITRRDSTDLTANTLTVTAPAGYYASAASKTLTDSNLSAGNIKKNVSIFGVTGTYEGSSSATLVTKTITANGTYSAQDDNADGYSQVTVNVSGGGAANIYQDENGYIVLDPGSVVTPAPEKWINFIDYDGTILYSYTKAEFAQLEALPSNPTHPNLVSQGWNWRLTDIQSELANGGLSKIWVGQMYNTQSGKTEIDVEFNDPDYLSPYLAVGTYSYTTLTVDWGDGSTPYSSNNNNATGLRYIQHTYPSVGKYTIKISAGESMYYFYNGYGSGHPSILYIEESSGDGNKTRNSTYANCIKAIRVSDHCHINAGAFRTLYGLEYMTISNTTSNVTDTSSYPLRYYAWSQDTSLKSLTIPYGVVKSTYNYAFFNSCTSLKNVSVPPTLDISAITECYSECKNIVHPYYPSTWTSIPSKYFYGCASLQGVTLPSSGLTTIEANAFNTNNTLMEITIPATVTTIGNDAFRYNYYMIYHFLSTTPPTLGNSTVFGGIATGCKIYVPSASVNAYKTATNWSTYADYIEAEPT